MFLKLMMLKELKVQPNIIITLIITIGINNNNSTILELIANLIRIAMTKFFPSENISISAVWNRQ